MDEGDIGQRDTFISTFNIVVLNRGSLYPNLTLQCEILASVHICISSGAFRCINPAISSIDLSVHLIRRVPDYLFSCVFLQLDEHNPDWAMKQAN